MNEYYYELVARPSGHIELFEDFLNDILPVGYEQKDDSFIIRSEEDLQTVKWGLEQFAEALGKATSQGVEIEIELTKHKNSDWIKEYQQSIRPLKIGKFYIHPTWDEPQEGSVNIAIDPALAFGTGHHPTTATCLSAVSSYVSEGKTVCDVGCGSGILAIAAMKLGAVADACDTDPVSVENARTNASLNGVEFRKIWQGSVHEADSTYDVVIANIVADVLVMLQKELKAALKDENSLLILSGILQKYEQKVLQSYSECDIVERIPQDEWVTLVLKKTKET